MKYIGGKIHIKKGAIDMGKYKIAGFIPAKGGSERIPRKNLKVMAGKPMMAWTIEASLRSRYIDSTFVSTEDIEVEKVAKEYGVEIVHRPAMFGQGQASVRLPWYHFKYWLLKDGRKFDYIVLLLPTSPLRTEEHIDGLIDLYFQTGKNVIAVYKSDINVSPYKLYYIDKSGHIFRALNVKQDESWEPRDLYSPNSSIIIDPFDSEIDDVPKRIIPGTYLPYIMSKGDSIDVDTPFDFKVAEMLLEERVKGRTEK